MLGFECKSLFQGVDASAASAGFSGKRGARRSHDSLHQEAEPLVSKKVKRSASPLWEENQTLSAASSLVEKQQSANSNASTATAYVSAVPQPCDAASMTTEYSSHSS
jgi:hypothetical protein